MFIPITSCSWLRLAALPGRVILTDQGNPEARPDSIMVLSGRRQHLQQPWPIFWTQHRNVDLVGPSLAHTRSDLMCAEAVYGKKRAPDDRSYNYRRRKSDGVVELSGNWTSLVSRWKPTDRAYAYGHWLQDALPRLALLDEFPSDVQILVLRHRLPYQIDSLKMLGLFDRCRWTSEPHLRVENYYFSAPTSMIACYNPYAVRWIRQAFLPRVEGGGPTPKRIFLRRFGPARNMVREDDVLDMFREFGWDIIDPGAWSFPEQVRLFSQAEAVSGIHGSGFANVVWRQPGCRILEIFAADYMCGSNEWISHCLPSVEYRSLIFPAGNRLNVVVDLQKLRKTLETF